MRPRPKLVGPRLSKKLTVSQTRLLRNIVDDPALPVVLGHMQPKTLARLVDRVGLNDAAELMALVPTRNLLRALDEAVWKSPRPGASEVFDATEFISWLQVWIEVGELFLAERLAAISNDYLAMCLSSVLLVDGGSSSGLAVDAAELSAISEEAGYSDRPKTDCYAIYGHIVVRPAYEDDWEILRAALDALWLHAPDRLLYLLGTLGSAESMLNSELRRISLNLDVAFERESYRERRGYVSPMGARALLTSASTTNIDDLLMMSGYDSETRRFLSGLEIEPADKNPIEKTNTSDRADAEPTESRYEGDELVSVSPSQDQIKTLSLLLENEEIIEPLRVESLSSNSQEKQPVLAELLNRLEHDNLEAFQQRARELAYLATVLMAGSSLESQPFTAGHARDAAFATCNIGLEFLQSRRAALKLDMEPGLIRLFLIGWQFLGTLRDRVIAAIEASFTDLESTPRLKNSPWLRNEAKIGIRDLQNAVEQHQFADARDAVIFLSIVFNATACRAIAPLLDHLPHFATMVEQRNKQPRWIESIADLDQARSLLSRLCKE
jgi:hypothetical protein